MVGKDGVIVRDYWCS